MEIIQKWFTNNYKEIAKNKSIKNLITIFTNRATFYSDDETFFFIKIISVYFRRTVKFSSYYYFY